MVYLIFFNPPPKHPIFLYNFIVFPTVGDDFFMRLCRRHYVIDIFYLFPNDETSPEFYSYFTLPPVSPLIRDNLCSADTHFISRMPLLQKLRLLFGRHVNIDLRRLNGAVSQQLLDIGNIHILLQQIGSH